MSEQPLIVRILRGLQDSEADLLTLKNSLGFQGQLLPALLWLHSMNFVARREVTLRNPVIRAKWSVTDSGRTYLAYVDTHPESIPYSSPELQVLLVAPEQIRRDVRVTAATDLSEALSDLLESARKEILISSPYIDEVIVPLIHSVPTGCPIKILTENAEKPLFTRLAQLRSGLEVRGLRQVTTENVQLYQVHAKFIVVDEASAIVTSANLNERSLYYNVEIGVLISDRQICRDMADVFNAIFATAIPLGRGERKQRDQA